MYEIAKRIKELRGRKGYSQEELAERSGLSLRTVQRIESGETEPRGDSLMRLAAAFDVSVDDIADWGVTENDGFIAGMNLSALSFLIFPLLGILVPLTVWLSKKDKIRKLNDAAGSLLNFQITWTIILFAGWIVSVLMLSSDMDKIGDVSPSIITGVLKRNAMFAFVMYAWNLIIILVNAVRIGHEKKVVYWPAIGFMPRSGKK